MLRKCFSSIWINRFFIFCFLVFSACIVTGQTKPDIKKTQQEDLVISFATDLTHGLLIFTKTFSKINSPAFSQHYTILNKAFDQPKPFEVQLTKAAFDSYFQSTTELSRKWPMLITRAQERKWLFTSEEGWTSLIEYCNDILF